MTQLRIGTLLGLFAGAFVLAWAAAGLMDSHGMLPAVPLLAPVALGAIAAVLLATALLLRSRIKAARERRPGARGVEPMMAARAVVLGQASALVVSVVSGVYGGLGIFLVLEYLDVSARRDQAIYAGLCVLMGVAVCAAALWLERICRLPEDDENGPLGSPA
ncbi:DUF3180 domain-containing protein [Streptomyces lonarensis]|uniref:DUF3180 domain-containing protein n=1 Tax=Streptomyces lonarensis TaxID=700599 RepID=A0A7X6HXD2_9ACTN|nr:DUF3180 domain-containing protein [Streptomyces lonarensis]NJQ04436.1 DUF3180 domain-containing protein [Streptomyces lonarensis]